MSTCPDSRGRTPKKKKRKETQRNVSDQSGNDCFENNDVSQSVILIDPVMVVPAPMKSPSGPLQGSNRIIKDHCADWHNYIDKWNVLNSKGLALINQIVTAKLQTQYNESPDLVTMRGNDTNVGSDSQGILGTQMPEGLDDLCAGLSDVIRSLEKVVKKMNGMTKHLQGVCEIQRSLIGSEESQPLFKTWPVHLFWETSSRLAEMYSKELALKTAIKEDVAHTNSRDILMMYTSSWLHEPYIDESVTLLLESMLQETGHR